MNFLFFLWYDLVLAVLEPPIKILLHFFFFFDAKLYCLRDGTLSLMNSVALARVMEWQAESNDHTSMKDVRGHA